ncbi:MAG: single-stranded-DNA-specific exonuclease RecJ [Bacteroidota bacterium]
MTKTNTRWTPLPYATDELRDLQAALKIHPIFCQILVQRGITNYKQAKQFFRPALEDLLDPFLMRDMKQAVERLTVALKQKQKILLYGDYDVDGTTAVALMYSFLKPYAKWNNLHFYIPDRYKEGYGISLQSIEFARANNFQLVLALDCGIRAVEAMQRAQSYGLDYIICDHHLPADQLPIAAAILDPKRADCAYPDKALSGCGIAFKLAQAFTQQHNLSLDTLYALLDLVVISIACDIVPMMGENRILAKFGLEQLHRDKRPGLVALRQIAQREFPLTISDIVFGFGPLINAAGRLADADRAVQLLIAPTFDEASKLAVVLAERNKMRKEFDNRMLEEATTIITTDPVWQNRKSIVLYQPHWHKGVVGIVAARIVERFNKPTIILTQSNGLVVGSARSVRGFNIHDAIASCENILVNFGGHAHAAGLKLHETAVVHFQDRFEGYVSANINTDALQAEILVNAQLPFQLIDTAFVRLLKEFAPFGPSNRNPVFVSRRVQDVGYTRILKDKHLKIVVRQCKDGHILNGIAFGRGEDFAAVTTSENFDICYTLEENKWKGETYLQLVVKDFKFPNAT